MQVYVHLLLVNMLNSTNKGSDKAFHISVLPGCDAQLGT